MALRASCGGRLRTQARHWDNWLAACVKAAGSSAVVCKQTYQLGAVLLSDCALAERTARASCTKSWSSTEKSGDFKARANDKSWRGDTSASSKATTSSTSGQSISSVFSGCWAAMCNAASSACIRPRRSRLRASTMMWWGRSVVPGADSCWCSQRAAWRHSSALRVSSTSRRGVVNELRQAGSLSGPSSSLSACASSRSRRGSL